MTDLRERNADNDPVQTIDKVIMIINNHGIPLLFLNEDNVASKAGIIPVVTPANRIRICSDKIIFLIFFKGNPTASISANDNFLWL